MRAQMSGAAWEAGFRNAGIVCAWVIPAYLLLLLALRFLVRLSWPTTLLVSLGLVLTSGFLVFLGIHLSMRFTRGAVLLDCGYRPMMWVFILNAVILPYFVIWHNSLFVGMPLAIKLLLTVPFSAFYLIMGFGRMQLCTNGIWIYQELIKWERIKLYEWQENALLVEYHTKRPIPAKGVLSFPPDCKWSVDLILQEHLGR